MASDVNTGGGARTVSALAARFFGWWFGELRACIPPVLRRLVAGRRRRLYLLLRDEVTDLYEESGGKPRVFGSIEQDAPDAPARVLLQRLQDKGPWAEILAVIPAERALRRRLQLPLAVAENLRESIGFDIDRLTPFRAEEVVYQARIAGIDRPARAGHLRADGRAAGDGRCGAEAGQSARHPPRSGAVEPDEEGTGSAGRGGALAHLSAGGAGRAHRPLAALAPAGSPGRSHRAPGAGRALSPFRPQRCGAGRLCRRDREIPQGGGCRGQAARAGPDPRPGPAPPRRRSARRCPWWWMCWPS